VGHTPPRRPDHGAAPSHPLSVSKPPLFALLRWSLADAKISSVPLLVAACHVALTLEAQTSRKVVC